RPEPGRLRRPRQLRELRRLPPPAQQEPVERTPAMSLRHRFSPRLRLLAWRLRYWWLDTPAGRAACYLGALLFALLAAWRGWALTQLPADAPQLAVVNFWVQLAIMVVASLVMMALAPKPKD